MFVHNALLARSKPACGPIASVKLRTGLNANMGETCVHTLGFPVKDLKELKNARVLRFREPAPVLGWRAGRMGETTKRTWVKPRVYPQENMGETTCLSTGMGETTIAEIWVKSWVNRRKIAIQQENSC